MSEYKQTIVSFSVPLNDEDMVNEFKTLLKYKKLTLSGVVRDLIRDYVIEHRADAFLDDPADTITHPIALNDENLDHHFRSLESQIAENVPTLNAPYRSNFQQATAALQPDTAAVDHADHVSHSAPDVNTEAAQPSAALEVDSAEAIPVPHGLEGQLPLQADLSLQAEAPQGDALQEEAPKEDAIDEVASPAPLTETPIIHPLGVLESQLTNDVPELANAHSKKHWAIAISEEG